MLAVSGLGASKRSFGETKGMFRESLQVHGRRSMVSPPEEIESRS